MREFLFVKPLPIKVYERFGSNKVLDEVEPLYSIPVSSLHLCDQYNRLVIKLMGQDHHYQIGDTLTIIKHFSSSKPFASLTIDNLSFTTLIIICSSSCHLPFPPLEIM